MNILSKMSRTFWKWKRIVQTDSNTVKPLLLNINININIYSIT